MLDSTSSSQTFALDVEHGGIRLALPLLTIVGFVVGYAVSTAVINALHADEAGCLALIAGLALALLTAVAADRFLKQIWPSGKSLSSDDGGLTFRDARRKIDVSFRWGQHINLLWWRFVVPRGSARVPKGWVMMGLQLLQDEAQITLYTFMPAKEAAALPTYANFTPLMSRAALDKAKLAVREAADQRRLLKAEDERWQNGVEVRREDFASLITVLENHVTPV